MGNTVRQTDSRLKPKIFTDRIAVLFADNPCYFLIYFPVRFVQVRAGNQIKQIYFHAPCIPNNNWYVLFNL